MPNPRAQKNASLRSTATGVYDAVTQGLLPMLGNAARGSVAATLGAPGDILGLLSDKQPLPTSQNILDYIPPVGSDKALTGIAETMGGFVPAPGSAGLVRAAKTVANPMTYGRAFAQAQAPAVMSRAIPDNPLIVQHNVRADKLAGADKLGGLPVPSLAISKADAPLTNFGDITLIAPKEFAKPSAKNPVYRSDAYTSRRPRIEVEVSKKGIDKLANIFKIDDYSARDLAQHLNDPTELSYRGELKKMFLKNIGELPPQGSMSSWDYSGLINSLTDSNPAYHAYVNNFVDSLPSMGIDATERIFKGYTQSGNRRYAPATLENIVKEMKGGANTEGFSYGVGNLRAVSQPKFRTFEQVQASRGNVLPSGEFEPIAKSLSDEYSNVTGLLSNAGRYDAGDALLEAAEKRNPAVLRRIYPELDAGTYDRAQGLLSRLADPNLPTEYFEVKPQRAVSLNEFSGAIVPGDASGSTIDILRRGGINDLQFYEPGSTEDRLRQFMKFRNQMFSAGAAAPAASLLYDEQSAD